jgi:hypothetical protein
MGHAARIYWEIRRVGLETLQNAPRENRASAQFLR